MKPVIDNIPRKLRHCHNLKDIHKVAKRCLPSPIYDHVAGGSDDEVTLSDNEKAFSKYSLVPRYCAGIGDENDLSTTVLGQKTNSPVIVPPWGGQMVVHRDGELGMAKAAHTAGSIFCLSTWSSTSLEDVAQATTGPKFFQLQPSRSKDLTRNLMQRAKAAGYTALLLTVDNPIEGNRERDARSGFGVPPNFSLKSYLSLASHPRWCWDMFRLRPQFANFLDYLAIEGNDMGTLAHQLIGGIDWGTVAWIAEEWDGQFAVKGILSAHDAKLAVQAGVTGVIVSNQGARHFDTAPATLEVLPEVLEAVGDQVDVILDGGIRRGTDVLKALALGAKACMTARPFAYGLAVAGEQGAAYALNLLKTEIKRDMIFLGIDKVTDITKQHIRPRDL